MNIFFLHVDPSVNAAYYCDKHVVKIILEIAQLLWTAWGSDVTDALPANVQRYRPTHKNHPMAIWVRKCACNYMYAALVGLALCAEYTRRYKKVHKCQPTLKWLLWHVPARWHLEEPYSATTTLAEKDNPVGVTPVPMCMPQEYRCASLITAYRRYYCHDKATIATWKFTSVPDWYNPAVKTAVTVEPDAKRRRVIHEK